MLSILHYCFHVCSLTLPMRWWCEWWISIAFTKTVQGSLCFWCTYMKRGGQIRGTSEGPNYEFRYDIYSNECYVQYSAWLTLAWSWQTDANSAQHIWEARRQEIIGPQYLLELLAMSLILSRRFVKTPLWVSLSGKISTGIKILINRES